MKSFTTQLAVPFTALRRLQMKLLSTRASTISADYGQCESFPHLRKLAARYRFGLFRDNLIRTALHEQQPRLHHAAGKLVR